MARNKKENKPAARKKPEASPKKKRGILTFDSRIRLMGVVFFLCIAVSVSAVGMTMISKQHLWTGYSVLNPAVRNSVITQTISGSRGDIVDRNNQIIATSAKAYTIAANFDNRTPDEKERDDQIIQGQRDNLISQGKASGQSEQVQAALEAADAKLVDAYVEDPEAFAKALKDVLGDVIDEDDILKRLKNAQENGYSQIELGTGTKRITEEQKLRLESMKIPGMSFIEDVRRTYPTTPLSSQAIGFATNDDNTGTITGRFGLEQTMNAYLSGKNGLRQYTATQADQILPGSETILRESENGDKVKLTLDLNLQETIESVLSRTMNESNASQAWAIVVEVKTGKILGWGSYPTYDQNTHLVLPETADNISQALLEQGSVVKPLVYAAAIDSGVYPPEDTYYRAGSFYYTVDPVTNKITRVGSQAETQYPPINDALGTDYGTLTFADGLAHSSNIAICELLTNYLDQQTFASYLDAFGLYKPVGSPFINELTGVGNYSQATDYLSTGFGQASSLTALELCQAYTAIFNDGKMMKPYLVDSILDSDTGEVIEQFSPECTGHPISAQTAQKVRQLMVHVGDAGMTGERFTIDGIDIAIKTGTGQIYNPNIGGYDKTNYTSTVMGAAPADDPQVMVFWGMQGPNYLNYSGSYFQDIMKAALKTAGVNYDNEQSDSADQSTWTSWTMPTLTSHTRSYAEQKLGEMSLKSLILGNGDTVIGQYPAADSTVNSQDRVLLMTNGDEIVMPDMTGWTLKDVTAFWQLTNIQVKVSGSGKVASQSVPEGTALHKGDTISVELWQQENPLKEPDSQTDSADSSSSTQSSSLPKEIGGTSNG